MTRKPLLVLFDGNGIIHRAYHAFQATRPLTLSKTGEGVSAVYGFVLMLFKAIKELKPTHYAIAFDRAAPTFRHEMFVEYKAQRPKTPEDLVSQFGRVRQLVEAFRIPIFEIDGFEADDVLGTLAKQAAGQGIETIIVTGDADTMQLVGPSVRVLYPRPGKTFSDTVLYDEAAVRERYGIKPEHIADLKGLVGDPSDNIPGVRGIGDKTAVRLIQQFGPIEEIYRHLDEVTPPRAQNILKEGETAARQSRELATIVTNVPVTLDLDKCRLNLYERNRVTELFRELEFFSLLPRLAEIESAELSAVEAKPPEGDYRPIVTEAELDGLVNRLTASPSFAFGLEATDPDPMRARVVGLSFSAKPGEAFYVPVGHEGLLVQQLPMENVLARLRPLFESAALAKMTDNANYRQTILAENGVALNNLCFDPILAAYLLGEKALSIKALAFGRLGVELGSIADIVGQGAKQLPVAAVEVARLKDYTCAETDMALRLAGLLEKELRDNELWGLFADTEMPLVKVLVGMQRTGVALDTDRLKEMSGRLGSQLEGLAARIHFMAGEQFNINSPQQLSRVLYEVLKLQTERRGKSARSTDAAALLELRETGTEEHKAFIDLVLEYRMLSKIKSTYVDALPTLVHPRTGRVHTSFNQTRTATGRLSSSDPNLQNIPVRGELGKKVREAFIAPEGSCLLAGDYSQIDLRALAHLSQDLGLVAAFQQNEDIHAATAARLFNVEPAKVTPDMRRVAKTVNFGVIYGMSEYGLEQATELSREEAGKFIEAYFEKYPGVKQYLEGTKEQARQTGYVQTILGRRRHIPEINSANRILREAAERMAINMPVQGTSADIIKVAMIKLDKEMARLGVKSRMLLQVHDELIFEVPDDELATMRPLVQDVMSKAMELRVPVKVDTKVGRNWGEME